MAWWPRERRGRADATPDDERNYDEQRAERNELAALVKEVREHKRTEWRTVDASKVLEAVRLIDAPGQRFHDELRQRPEFRAHRQKLDEIKKEAQHVATCMRRIKERLRELCGREELGAHRARLEQAAKAADEAVDVAPLVEQLRGLLAPDERELLGLDHDNVTRAVRLEEGEGLKLRRVLAEWGSPSFVCRNGIIADWNPVMAACTAGNAVPLTLGAGSASKATAMYSVRVRRPDPRGAGSPRLTPRGRDPSPADQVHGEGLGQHLRSRDGAACGEQSRHRASLLRGRLWPARAHVETSCAARHQPFCDGAGRDASGSLCSLHRLVWRLG